MSLPIPTPRTWTDDELVTPQDLNTEIRDTIEFLLNKPIFRGAPNTGNTSGNNQWTQMTFTYIAVDNTGLFDSSTPDQITVKVPGTYEFYAQARFFAGNDGDRRVRIRKNGTIIAFGEIGANPQGGTVVACSCAEYLGPSDVIKLDVQESGSGSQYLGGDQGSLGYATTLMLKWISRDY